MLRSFYKFFACGYAAIAIVLTVFSIASEVHSGERAGLRRMAFSGVEFTGTPFLDDISSDVTLDFLENDPTLPRRFFSARWQASCTYPRRPFSNSTALVTIVLTSGSMTSS